MTLDPKDFKETIQLIMDTLGTNALLTFVGALIKHNSDDKKAMQFCEEALEQVGDEELTGFQRLPE